MIPKSPYSLDPEAPDAGRAIEDALATALPPAHLPPGRQDAIRRRLMERVRTSQETDRQFIHVALSEGEWRQILPGVRMKPLGAAQRAVLLDIAPGASLPPHRHHEEEECVVLRGEVTLGDLTVRQGDYHLARHGSRHGTVRSTAGALIYLGGTPLGHGAQVLRDLVTAWTPGQGDAPVTLREADGDWAEIAPGVRSRVLRDDGVCRSTFLRLDPGARLARPRGQDEECLLVEGEAFQTDRLLRPGDYQIATQDIPDGAFHSDVGALLFLRSASGGAALAS